ncbi:MAG: SWIM zinc finger family protein [Candidatus Lokiarchaeota archaeon]|nr:SWIM zinc finger family protein [Candidatus Lokiarchaeota archaeon]
MSHKSDDKIKTLLQFGSTWWGRSWIKSMLKYGRFFRMQRGITYTKENRVSNIIIKKGEIFALCQGTAPVPYRVKIEFTPIVSEQWRQVIEEMGQTIEIEAKLLSGEMPQHINKLFLRKGVPLFPVPKQNLDATCNCPDEEIPCKHIAAVILTLASIFDYDPFMLFELRGKSREELLSELQFLATEGEPRDNVMRSGQIEPNTQKSRSFLHPDISKLQSIEFDISPLESTETLFHQLGTPSEIKNHEFSEVMSTIYRDVSQFANELIYHKKKGKSLPKKE